MGAGVVPWCFWWVISKVTSCFLIQLPVLARGVGVGVCELGLLVGAENTNEGKALEKEYNMHTSTELCACGGQKGIVRERGRHRHGNFALLTESGRTRPFSFHRGGMPAI